MARPSVVSASVALLALCPAVALGFYVPGVAPTGELATSVK